MLARVPNNAGFMYLFSFLIDGIIDRSYLEFNFPKLLVIISENAHGFTLFVYCRHFTVENTVSFLTAQEPAGMASVTKRR